LGAGREAVVQGVVTHAAVATVLELLVFFIVVFVDVMAKDLAAAKADSGGLGLGPSVVGGFCLVVTLFFVAELVFRGGAEHPRAVEVKTTTVVVIVVSVC
jgi:hypothetical protein